MKRSIIVMAVLAFSVSGCVKKSVHEETLKQLADTKNQLDQSSKKGMSLEDALEKEKKNVANLEKKIDQLKSALASTEKLLADEKDVNAKLNETLASTINDKAKLKASADELKNAVAELQKRKKDAEERVKEFRDLLDKFKSLIDAGKLQVEIRDGRMVLVLPTDILFASGSADLSEEGIIAVQDVAKILVTIKDREFQIGGHTDNVPLASKKRFKSNWDLAAKRAMGVVNAMIEAGMKGSKLSAASYGEFRPIASNKTKEGQAKNRRIDIVIVPDLSKLPGFEELQTAVEQKK
ncbi:MAG: OmpA family protein [Deltaproteobacteria bacterium]|nr:OmpA family protein [Deltaproteobacteria bacterium]